MWMATFVQDVELCQTVRPTAQQGVRVDTNWWNSRGAVQVHALWRWQQVVDASEVPMQVRAYLCARVGGHAVCCASGGSQERVFEVSSARASCSGVQCTVWRAVPWAALR